MSVNLIHASTEGPALIMSMAIVASAKTASRVYFLLVTSLPIPCPKGVHCTLPLSLTSVLRVTEEYHPHPGSQALFHDNILTMVWTTDNLLSPLPFLYSYPLPESGVGYLVVSCDNR